MRIKALDDLKKLYSDFNEADGAFFNAVLGAPQTAEIPIDLPRTYLAHPAAMTQASGVQAAADYSERVLLHEPDIDLTLGGSLQVLDFFTPHSRPLASSFSKIITRTPA